MVHRLNQHSLSPLDAWCICLCSQPHIWQCLWHIALHINVCFTCHYVHVQSPRIIFLSADLLCSAVSLLFLHFLCHVAGQYWIKWNIHDPEKCEFVLWQVHSWNWYWAEFGSSWSRMGAVWEAESPEIPSIIRRGLVPNPYYMSHITLGLCHRLKLIVPRNTNMY